MLTSILSSAWAVNFNVGIRSFEEQHIKGVHNLVQFSLSVLTPVPARFFFCSSVATTLGSPRSATILEIPILDLNAALPQGYARSKLVSEHIVRNAARDAGALTRTLRIGQIVGDGKMGLWNDTEAIPLIIRSALTLKVLPALDETESWLPVDISAATYSTLRVSLLALFRFLTLRQTSSTILRILIPSPGPIPFFLNCISQALTFRRSPLLSGYRSCETMRTVVRTRSETRPSS